MSKDVDGPISILLDPEVLQGFGGGLKKKKKVKIDELRQHFIQEEQKHALEKFKRFSETRKRKSEKIEEKIDNVRSKHEDFAKSKSNNESRFQFQYSEPVNRMESILLNYGVPVEFSRKILNENKLRKERKESALMLQQEFEDHLMQSQLKEFVTDFDDAQSYNPVEDRNLGEFRLRNPHSDEISKKKLKIMKLKNVNPQTKDVYSQKLVKKSNLSRSNSKKDFDLDTRIIDPSSKKDTKRGENKAQNVKNNGYVKKKNSNNSSQSSQAYSTSTYMNASTVDVEQKKAIEERAWKIIRNKQNPKQRILPYMVHTSDLGGSTYVSSSRGVSNNASKFVK
eukprot:TRINITY_DN2314_c0_g1_i1.p1 TRINITY_DN2314_c0_g1~~TRINITY_DN2314_c0_g1_i1.p1  ORF type:complete len:338 (+),score=80.31 TRINITY_DN2314_c0_g1_i1:63-1076(+)